MKKEYTIELSLPYVIKSKLRHKTNFKTQTHYNTNKKDEDEILYDVIKFLTKEDIEYLNKIKSDERANISVSVINHYNTKDKKKIGQPKITTPDTDNFLKLFMDAVNGELWKDDRQVFKVSAEKWYGDTNQSDIIIEYYR